jgi:choice-of-anchor C domain-containing protein
VLWDLESGVAVRQAQGPAGHRRLAARPNGSLVLTADRDGIVRIWLPSPLRLPGAPKANLLVNGSFELGPDVQDVPLGPGSIAIPGWTVTREPIDCISNALRAADGKRCLDIHGSPGCGGIRQSFLTTKGQRYRVTFAMAGSIPGGTTGNREIKNLGVSAAGMKGEFTFDTTGKSPDNMGWTTKTWEFVAIDGETSLEFYSVDRKNPLFGPALDDVRVVALPGNNSSP